MYNTDLEFKVTSILFHNNYLLGHRLVNRDDFFTDNGDSIEKMLIIHDRGGIINETTIGKKYPSVLQEDVDNFNDYVKTLKGLSYERRLQNIPDEMTKIALNAKFALEERHLKMKNLLDSVSISNTNPDECRIDTFLDSIVEDIINGELPDTTSTGIYDLDELLAGGFSRGDFVLIAGDSGNYKSTLMYNICLNVARLGKPVLIISYENIKKEISEILISMQASLNSRMFKSRKVHNNNLKDDKQLIKKITQAKEELAKLPIYVVDGDVDLTDIKLLALTNKIELVAIDYIQIMPETKRMNKTEAVGLITRELKMFTKPDALNCPVIGLSQFAKVDKNAGPRRRTKADLKDSSTLEHDPNIIIFTEKHETRTHNGKKINIRVMKNRNGEEGELNLDVNPMYHMIYGSKPCVPQIKENI